MTYGSEMKLANKCDTNIGKKEYGSYMKICGVNGRKVGLRAKKFDALLHLGMSMS